MPEQQVRRNGKLRESQGTLQRHAARVVTRQSNLAGLFNLQISCGSRAIAAAPRMPTSAPRAAGKMGTDSTATSLDQRPGSPSQPPSQPYDPEDRLHTQGGPRRIAESSRARAMSKYTRSHTKLPCQCNGIRGVVFRALFENCAEDQRGTKAGSSLLTCGRKKTILPSMIAESEAG